MAVRSSFSPVHHFHRNVGPLVPRDRACNLSSYAKNAMSRGAIGRGFTGLPLRPAPVIAPPALHLDVLVSRTPQTNRRARARAPCQMISLVRARV